MSLATETDPVETIRLALDDQTTAGDWAETGSKPAHIETLEATTFNEKTNRSGDAVYIWQPDPGAFAQRGAEWANYVETRVVQADAWTLTGENAAYHLAKDVRDIIFANYATDNETATTWLRIVPTSELDNRAQTTPRRADHYTSSVQIALLGLRET